MGEGLRDPKMHQAALKGVVTAANPLKDLSVPALPQTNLPNPLKAVQSTLKEVSVDIEAAMLSNASGLTRAKPPARPSSQQTPQSGQQSVNSPLLTAASPPSQLLGGAFD